MKNKLPKNIQSFDGKEEVTLELPKCVYCNEFSCKDKPVKIYKETGEMVCYQCRIEFLEDEFFPTLQSEESEIHEKLFEDQIPF